MPTYCKNKYNTWRKAGIFLSYMITLIHQNTYAILFNHLCLFIIFEIIIIIIIFEKYTYLKKNSHIQISITIPYLPK